MEKSIWGIVGLGNPGSKYQKTRHNVGWMVIERFLSSFSFSWKEKFKGQTTTVDLRQNKIALVLPQTFMNLSGESVRPFCDFYKITMTNLIVVHDELDLPFGTFQLKKGGGFAGHNGLKSMGEHLGSADFMRIRVGIGRPEFGDVSSYVLSPFSQEENIALGQILDEVKQCLECLIDEGYDSAVMKYNKRKKNGT